MRLSHHLKRLTLALFGAGLFAFFFAPGPLRAARADAPPMPKGLQHLTRNAYGSPWMTMEEFDRLWTVWDAEWKSRARPEDPAALYEMTLERYGLTRGLDPASRTPLQFVSTPKGLVPNCLLCHSGRLPGSGKAVVGLPNSEIDVATLFEDLERLRGAERSAAHWNAKRGHTNAFFFSHIFLQRRAENMDLLKTPVNLGRVTHYDLDAPPWWNLKKKQTLYIDGFVRGGFNRAIMQFAMEEADGPTFRSWEKDFADVLSMMLSLQPPKYPWPVDRRLAAEGKKVFEKNCAECHGTYGPAGRYPNRMVPIDTIGTDRTRLTGMTREFRAYYGKTWLGQTSKIDDNPAGYVAPPLDGIWASAPYFHNGTVPTVYGVLTAEARPKYFRRIGLEYDPKNLGLKVEILNAPPADSLPIEARRRVMDTTLPGLGNQGHPFGFHLSEKEKRQVIEYMKTL